VTNKSELLQQLKIDRSEVPPKNGISVWFVVLVVLLTAGITIWLTLKYATGMSQTDLTGKKVTSTSQVTPQSTPTAANNSVPNPANSSDTILNASGYVTARRMATVSAEIMGLIKEVNVEEGMEVAEGQVLARLDDVIAKANYDFAVAQIDVLTARKESIIANMDEAKRNYQRVLNNNYSSEADRTQALANQQSLVAALKGGEADIRLAQIEANRQQERLDDHTIRAPFAGVVTVKNAQPGEIVAPTSAGGGFTRTGICTIVDMNSLEIEVDVNESFIGRVRPGQTVQAHLDAYPEWQIPASVIAIIPTADRAKATVSVRIQIELDDARILPDMGVKVAFLKE
jgi:HlyD family secretion protein